MGGIFSIGIVFDGTNIEQNLQNLIQELGNNDGKINSVKYSIDSEGEDWKEEYNIRPNTYKNISKSFYGSINLNRMFIGIHDINLIIYVVKESDYFGFLITIKNDDIFTENCCKEQIKNDILSEIIKLSKFLKFSYAFAGLDAEIEFSPAEYNNIKDYYSISVINKANQFEVIYGEFQIDGISFQNKKIEIIEKNK